MDGWKTLDQNLLNNSVKSIPVWKSRARYTAGLASRYIPGTFGRAGFVSFGDCTLNSRSPGRVMCRSAPGGCHGQIKYTARPSWMSKPMYLCGRCHRVFLLKVEIWVEKQLWTLASAIRRAGIKEEPRYLKRPLNDDRRVTASFMSGIGISSALMPETEYVTGF